MAIIQKQNADERQASTGIDFWREDILYKVL